MNPWVKRGLIALVVLAALGLLYNRGAASDSHSGSADKLTD
jgi:hypothetical protein